MSQFIYLLNAMEAAAQADKSAEHGYAEKRKAVLEYVTNLERSSSSSIERAEPLDQAGMKKHGEAWVAYCNAFRDLFGFKCTLELSPAALQEMVERLTKPASATKGGEK